MYYTYITTNPHNTVFYTGTTNDLNNRGDQHKNKINKSSFTAKYNAHKVVWYEVFEDAYDAIAAEKKIKGWSRAKKKKLIKENNPLFKDLLEEIYGRDDDGSQDSSPASSE